MRDEAVSQQGEAVGCNKVGGRGGLQPGLVERGMQSNAEQQLTTATPSSASRAACSCWSADRSLRRRIQMQESKKETLIGFIDYFEVVS